MKTWLLRQFSRLRWCGGTHFGHHWHYDGLVLSRYGKVKCSRLIGASKSMAQWSCCNCGKTEQKEPSDGY